MKQILKMHLIRYSVFTRKLDIAISDVVALIQTNNVVSKRILPDARKQISRWEQTLQHK